jgi:MFS family permease
MDRNKKKGIIWFSIGVVALVISIVCFIVSLNLGGWGFLLFIASLIGIATGSLFVVLGAILFFVGNREKRRRVNGIIPFWIGVVAIVIGLVCGWLGWASGEAGLGWIIISIGVIAIGVLLVYIGAILFLVYKREAKKAKNQNKPQDAGG